MGRLGGNAQAPAIRDLTTGEEEPEPKARPPGPADLILVTGRQLEEGLAQVREVDALPEAGPGIAFFPIGPDVFIGVPFCQTVDPQQRCWPMSPGPDDNPFTYSCSCDTTPFEGDTAPEIIDCSLGVFAEVGGPLTFRCVNQRCGDCQPVYRRTPFIVYTCECAE
jgi:hypothetical protein